MPEHLPREIVTHVLSRDCCPDCGDQLRQFGEDISEQLEPAHNRFLPENVAASSLNLLCIVHRRYLLFSLPL